MVQVAVALADDTLVFVDLQDDEGGQRAAVVVDGKAGGEGVKPVEPAWVGDRLLVAVPGDPGFAGPGAGGDGDQALRLAGEDLRGFGVDLPAGLVVTAAEPVGDLGEGGLGLVQGALAGGGAGGGFLRWPDVG